MSDYFTLVTAAGQAKLAAFAAGGPAVVLARVSVGDANGVPYTPNEAQAALTHEVWRTSAISVSAASGSTIVAEAVIPADLADDLARPSGGFNVLEAGLWDDAGVLIAIAKMPARYKPLPASGAADDMTIRLVINVGSSAGLVVTIGTDSVVPINRLPRLPFIAVISATTTAPPGAPAAGDTYLIPNAATGAWAGKGGQVAQYHNGAWAYSDPPVRTMIGVANGGYVERVAGGAWVTAQFGAGYVADSGVANAYVATLNPAATAYSEGMRVRFKASAANTGASTLNVNGLGSKAIKRRDGSALKQGDLPAGAICEVTYDGVNFQLTTTGGGWSFAGRVNPGVGTLTPDHVGKFTVLNSGVYTLPVAEDSSLGSGVLTLFCGAGGGTTVQRQGADIIADSAANFTSITLADSECLVLLAATAGVWYVVGRFRARASPAEVLAGANTDKFVTPASLAGLPKSTLAVSGYFRLPSGLIVQYVNIASGATVGDFSFSWPLAFPTSCLSGSISNAGPVEAAHVSLDNITTTGGQYHIAGAAANTLYIIGIGH